MVPAVVIRNPVAVLTIVPAAVPEVGADSPNLVYHWAAVDRGPIDRVDDGLLNGTARQRGGRDGRGCGGQGQEDFSHGIFSIGISGPVCMGLAP